MKKIILAVAVTLFASQAFAATGSGTATGAIATMLATPGLSAYGGKVATNPPTLIGKTSTGVGLGWSTGATGYAMETQHKSGNRAYGTSYDSTAIFFKEVTTVGVAVAPASATASDATAFAGWTSM